jgi:RNA polymerase sigma-70 factor, ECF subfamily
MMTTATATFETIGTELVERAKAGNREAQKAVLDAYGGLVYALCRRLARQPDDAYQDIWARVFTKLDSFDASRPGSLKSWVMTVAHRHLIDRHRRLTTQGHIVPLDGIGSSGPDPEAEASRLQRARRLEEALTELSDDHRRVVVLHHIHGVPLQDIADVEEVAVGTIKSRLHRARAELADRMGGAS